MRKSLDWPFPAVPSQALTAAKYVGLAVGAWLLYKLVTRGVLGTASDVTRGAAGAVLDAGAGVVIGAGQAVGVPATDQDACMEAMHSGRTWDASFACPAGTFIGYVLGNRPAGETTETVWTEPNPNWAAGLQGLPVRRRRRSLNRNC